MLSVLMSIHSISSGLGRVGPSWARPVGPQLGLTGAHLGMLLGNVVSGMIYRVPGSLGTQACTVLLQANLSLEQPILQYQPTPDAPWWPTSWRILLYPELMQILNYRPVMINPLLSITRPVFWAHTMSQSPSLCAPKLAI